MICKISIGRAIYTRIGIIIEDFNMFIANRKRLYLFIVSSFIDLLLILLLISCWFIIMIACYYILLQLGYYN